ncbi:MAG: hypothetical protein NZL89_07300, partial [Leptospiraceae bacterium]|nr:hypothetical protein [Leptospiraceae bacterium]
MRCSGHDRARFRLPVRDGRCDRRLTEEIRLPDPIRDAVSGPDAFKRLAARLIGGGRGDDAALDVPALCKEAAAVTAFLDDLALGSRWRDLEADP